MTVRSSIDLPACWKHSWPRHPALLRELLGPLINTLLSA